MSRSGSIGLGCRFSVTKNSAAQATTTTAQQVTPGEAQPRFLPSTTTNTDGRSGGEAQPGNHQPRGHGPIAG